MKTSTKLSNTWLKVNFSILLIIVLFLSTNIMAQTANLSSLSVDEKANGSFVPLMMFKAANYSYDYYLVKGNPIPVISGELSGVSDVKIVTQATSLTGTDTEKTANIEVTTLDGSTKNTYSVRFIETDNVFLSGLTKNSDKAPIGWTSSGLYFDSSKAEGNNKYEGTNSVRLLSTMSSSFLRLPQTKSVGTLRFYARKFKDDVVGNLKVSTKIDAGEWTTVQDLGNISNLTYQEISVVVNQTAVDSMFVRIEIDRTGTSKGYYIDDISYTESTSNAVINPFSDIKINVLTDKIIVSGASNQQLFVANLTGQTLISKKLYSDMEIVYLPNGFYILSVGNERYKIRVNKN